MTRQDFDRIRAELIDTGYNVAEVARRLKRNRETVTRVLRQGYPSLGFPAVQPDAAPAPAAPAAPQSSAGLASVVKTPEQSALSNHVQNSIGTSVAISQILKKLVEQAPAILSRITGDGTDPISPREYLGFVRDISRANAASSKAIAEVSAASRAAAGVPNVQQVQHLHAHAVMGGGSQSPQLEAADGSHGTQSGRGADDAHGRMKRLMESYARLSQPVEYEMEEGMIGREENEITDDV